MAQRIYPEFDEVRNMTVSGVHSSVGELYDHHYDSKTVAKSVPLNKSHPRFYLEMTDKGDLFMVTANSHQRFFQGFGETIDSGKYTLLKLEGSLDEVVCRCLQVKIGADKEYCAVAHI